MKNTYFNIERLFERLTLFVTQILGNSITFLIAFCMVLYWWSTNLFTSNDAHQNIGDIIFGITFLSLFIIQKSFNRHTALIHLKMNELISSHETANNAVMDTSDKTEREITKLHEEYIEMIESVEEENEVEISEKDNK
ncbi:low affinity iron permease family protein [Flavobacterium sp.]|uniref:low affinity iron permease family protein n=1 Tax=Flavobacterium sp. TaxID=239 RepID=UPI00374FEEA5